MAIEKDKLLDPNNKARWGFAGEAGKITVGPQTVGETGGVDTARTPSSEEAARGNGGGAEADALRAQVADLRAQLEQANTTLAAANATTTATSTASAGSAESLDELTVVQLKEQLDAKGITYKSTDAKADLVAALKAAS
jgi:hypothetical protein